MIFQRMFRGPPGNLLPRRHDQFRPQKVRRHRRRLGLELRGSGHRHHLLIAEQVLAGARGEIGGLLRAQRPQVHQDGHRVPVLDRQLVLGQVVSVAQLVLGGRRLDEH